MFLHFFKDIQHEYFDFHRIANESIIRNTVKPVLSCHSKKDQKLVFMTDYGLMQVKSIAECSKGSILQYFGPSLSYHLSLRSLFCLFLSGRLRQVLLYVNCQDIFHTFGTNVNIFRTSFHRCVLKCLYFLVI